MTLQEIFNKIMFDEPAQVCVTQRQYGSLRVMLLRKWKAYADQCNALDIPGYDDRYLRCTYNSKSLTATFELAYTDTKQRQRIDYTVL